MSDLFTSESFNSALQAVLHTEHRRYNIGTYSEGTLHIVLKNAVENDIAYHEVPIEGYIADIFKDNTVTEIQTRDFRRLNEKLSAFLPKYSVNVVYPVAYVKRISKLNEETGEMSKARKSNKNEKAFNILPELFYIQGHLKDPNLNVYICLLDITEYRMVNPKRKSRMMRFDRVPNALTGVIKLKNGDYGKLLPCTLKEQFTAKEFSTETRMTGMRASRAIKALLSAGAIEQIGKSGRAYVYRINEF